MGDYNNQSEAALKIAVKEALCGQIDEKENSLFICLCVLQSGVLIYFINIGYIHLCNSLL